MALWLLGRLGNVSAASYSAFLESKLAEHMSANAAVDLSALALAAELHHQVQSAAAAAAAAAGAPSASSASAASALHLVRNFAIFFGLISFSALPF